MDPIINSLFENAIVDQTFNPQLNTCNIGLTAVNPGDPQQNLNLLSIVSFLGDTMAKVQPEPTQITTPNLAEGFDSGSNWNTNQQVANVPPLLTQNSILSPDYQQYLSLLLTPQLPQLSAIQPAPLLPIDTLNQLIGNQYQQPLLTQVHPQFNSHVFVPQKHKNPENMQINQERNKVSRTVTGKQYNFSLEDQTILLNPNQNPVLWSLNDMALLTQNQYQNQDLTNLKPDTSALRHQVSNNRKNIRNPDKFHIPDQYDAILGKDIVKNGIIQCQNLLEKVTYERKKLKITRKVLAERVLGKTVAALNYIFESDRHWKDLRDIGKQNYWNLFQWVNASDSGKMSMIRGEQQPFSTMNPINPLPEKSITTPLLIPQLDTGNTAVNFDDPPTLLSPFPINPISEDLEEEVQPLQFADADGILEVLKLIAQLNPEYEELSEQYQQLILTQMNPHIAQERNSQDPNEAPEPMIDNQSDSRLHAESFTEHNTIPDLSCVREHSISSNPINILMYQYPYQNLLNFNSNFAAHQVPIGLGAIQFSQTRRVYTTQVKKAELVTDMFCGKYTPLDLECESSRDKNLIERFKFKIETLGVSKKLIAKHVLGISYPIILQILNPLGCRGKWKPTKQRRHQVYQAISQWLDLPDAEKTTVLMADSTIKFFEEFLATLSPNSDSAAKNAVSVSDLTGFQSEASQAVQLDYSNVMKERVQAAQIFQLDPNDPIWTYDSVIKILTNALENQGRRINQEALATPTSTIQKKGTSSQNVTYLNPKASPIRQNVPDSLGDDQIGQETEQERDPKQTSAKKVQPTAFQSYPRRYAGNDAALNLLLEKDGVIQGKNLIERVNYELTTRGIKKPLFSRMVLGRSHGPLCRILGSPKEWGEITTRRGKEMYLNLLQWVIASESDKMAILNGQKPSDPSIRLSTTPAMRTRFTAEQRATLIALCREEKIPKLEKRQELASEWGMEEMVVRNFVNKRVQVMKKKREKE